jgi:hypothetical protein
MYGRVIRIEIKILKGGKVMGGVKRVIEVHLERDLNSTLPSGEKGISRKIGLFL